VRSNGGRGGIDRETIQAIEQRGPEEFLSEIEAALRAGRYRPSAVKRRWIPKADGKAAAIGDSDGQSRVVQMAAKLVIEPIFEAIFSHQAMDSVQRGVRRKALEANPRGGQSGPQFVVDADIQGYFDNIDRSMLMEW